MFTDFVDDLMDVNDDLHENGGDLVKWDLFLMSASDIIPYTFAYDNIHYSDYLSSTLGEMLILETNNPEVRMETLLCNYLITVRLAEWNQTKTLR